MVLWLKIFDWKRTKILTGSEKTSKLFNYCLTAVFVMVCVLRRLIVFSLSRNSFNIRYFKSLNSFVICLISLPQTFSSLFIPRNLKLSFNFINIK